MEAIILAGGLGTRLRSVVNEVPKSMAQIRSKPFLEYQLDQLIAGGISRFIFSVGYKSEHIQQHFSDNYKNCEIVYAFEETLLGTGGAIKNAMKYVESPHVIVVNGDSIFKTNLREQYKAHLAHQADVTLALKPMQDIERYGTVQLTNEDKVTRFLEKQSLKEGFINGGVYIFNVTTFKQLELPEKFSIEKDFFETNVQKLNFRGFISHGYFLDIGIPTDFLKAEYEIGVFPFIDDSWTLFLDRDGVINKKIEGDYVKSLQEFEFLPSVIESISRLSKWFGKIIIVTNQQGIGKGIMTAADLYNIHQFLLEKINEAGGNINAIYHAPQLESERSEMRKPGIGMALQAQKDFPGIVFNKSIMVGDSMTDIDFAKKAQMISILVTNKPDATTIKDGYYSVDSLVSFTQLLTTILDT